MLAWDKRPVEIATLFNPAFCGLLIRDATVGYTKEASTGLSYALSFLVLPLVLHKPTREAIPKTISTHMHAWLQDDPSARIGFAKRIKALSPYTKESILFSIQHQSISIDGSGDLINIRARMKALDIPKSSEPNECRQKATFVGRWLARAGTPSAIYSMWGIKP